MQTRRSQGPRLRCVQLPTGLHDTGECGVLLREHRLHPVDDSPHTGCAAQIAVNDESVFRSQFGDRRGQPFE